MTGGRFINNTKLTVTARKLRQVPLHPFHSLEKRIAELENALANARILDEENINTDKAYLLSTITIYNHTVEKEVKYTLVSKVRPILKRIKRSKSSSTKSLPRSKTTKSGKGRKEKSFPINQTMKKGLKNMNGLNSCTDQLKKSPVFILKSSCWVKSENIILKTQ